MEKFFTRDGDEVTEGYDFDESGKPVRLMPIACDSCHVINGQRLWIMGIENGRPFSATGFDCWTCGNTGVRGEHKQRLYTEKDLARLNKAAATREAKRHAAFEKARAEAAAQRDAFVAEHAEFLVKLNSVCGDDAENFWNRLRDGFLSKLKAPTERQIELVEGEVAKRAMNATSGFLGAVGDRITVTCTVERIIALPDYGFGVNYINLLRDGNGNLLVYKGMTTPNAGETFTMKATVSEHNVRDGVKQTIVKRPKVLEQA